MLSPFDEARYRALLEGLEISEVSFSETLTNKDFRTDSDFWTKAPKQNSRLVYVPIGSILTTSQYGISIEMNEDGVGYPIYRMNEIHNMLCDFDVNKRADIDTEELCLFSLNDRDVLFNRTNSYEWVGRTGLFRKQEGKDFVFASYLVRFVPDKTKVLPEYLVAFLSSIYGVWDIRRRARHSINQTNVNPEEVKAIQIPLLADEIQQAIKSCFDRATENLLEAKRLNEQAEALLLNALNLSTYIPTTKNSNIKSFKESFAVSGRLDAEYYQPKFDEIEELIKNNGEYFKRIEEIQSYNSRGMAAIYDETGTVDMITQKHILETGLDYDNFDKTDIKHFSPVETSFVSENDILIYGTGANIGRAQPYLSEKKAVACQDIIILRVIEDPVYVAFVINSFIGRLQTEKMRTGSAQPHLYPKDVAQFLIPFVEKNIQKKIRDKIISSLLLKKESATLLETAKRAVEIAIEQDENAGMAYIDLNYRLGLGAKEEGDE